MPNLHGTMRINDKNHLEIGGVDVVEVGRENEYPVYVIDEDFLREKIREYREAFKKYYPNSMVHYASKAFMNSAMCKIVNSEDIGLDVVSGGELFTAINANFPTEKIVMHGNNKSKREILMAIENSVTIVIDNFYEIDLIDSITKELNKKVNVLLRIKPGIAAETHHYVNTGHEDSKFGFIIKEGIAEKAVKKVVASENMIFRGLHMHIGSQIFKTNGYEKSIEIMTDLMKRLKDENIEVNEFDLGGGLGAIYIKEDKPMAIDNFIKLLIDKVILEFNKKGLSLPMLRVEPGRSIIAEAGTTIYRVGSITEVPGIRKYIAINGGMGDNIRPALYDSKYSAVIANKMDIEPNELVTVAGNCCETGDILIKDIMLQNPESEDILAVFTTGAYNYSMANHYNRLPIPGVLLVKDGKKDWIVKPENYEDIIKNDIIPDRLK